MTAVGSDEPLAAKAAELLGPGHPVFAAALVTSAAATLATREAGTDDTFEIGSISKGITGLLFMDALAREEIGRETTLRELLPLRGVPVGELTLASISTHRSGLPGLPKSSHPLRRTIALWRHGTNPYGEDLDQLLTQARGVVMGKPRPRYSNLGFELLGHAVASAAGTTFAELVEDRLAGPLGLESFYVPATSDQLRASALTGRSRRNRPRQPWTGEAIGPAGGIRASIGDMARLAVALLTGSVPGIAALDPVAPFKRSTRIGAGWVTTEVGGRSITWHNGGTGGFRSWMGLDRTAGTGAVILSATSASVDRHGFALLADHTTGAAG